MMSPPPDCPDCQRAIAETGGRLTKCWFCDSTSTTGYDTSPVRQKTKTERRLSRAVLRGDARRRLHASGATLMATLDERLDAEIARRSGGQAAPVDPIDAEIARRGQGGHPTDQAPPSPSSFDPTMMMMEGMDAAEQHRQRQMDAMQASAQPTQAGMAAPPAQQTPQRQTDPAMPPAPPIPGVVGTPRTLGSYLSETGQNIPSSVKALGEDMWHAATNPLQTLEGMGSAAVGGIQHAKDAVGIPTLNTFGDQREAGSAAGQYFQRYHPDNLATTFRTDPAGTAVDALGALSGAGGAARGAMKLAPHMRGQDLMPLPQGAPQAAPPRMTREQFVEGAPSTAQLKAAGGALFEAAENAGVRFAAKDYTMAVDKMSVRLMKEGLDPVLHPRVARVHALMNETIGNNPSLPDLMILRKQFGAAAKSLDPDERRLASLAIDRLDKFVESGDSATSGVLRDARRLWGQMRRSEILEDAIERGKDAQSGVEAGLRNEFRGLHRAIINKRKDMRGFSADEKAAIKAVAQGNITSNVLRRIGSLSGGSGAQRNMLNLLVGGSAGAGAGGMIAGPFGSALGAAAVPAIGAAAQKMATRGTQGRADLARAVTARGEPPPTGPSRSGRMAREAAQAPVDAMPLAALMAGMSTYGDSTIPTARSGRAPRR